MVGAGNCTNALFGAAQAFDLFVLGTGDQNVTTGLNVVNGQFAGRVAVNSGARLNDFGIGNSLNCTAANATNFNFIVQNDLNATNGELFCGSALVGGNVTNPLTFRQVNEGANLVSGVDVSISGIDFASATSFLTGVNQAVCALNCTNVTLGQANELRFTGAAGANSTQIFCVRSADLSRAASIVFDFAANFTAPIVINIQGSPNDTTASFRSAAIQRGRLRSEQLLWNVCDSLDVTLSQFQLFGSLLAPNSSLTISNAEQEGITVVSTLSGQGFQKRLAPFNGFFCQPL